MKMSQFGADASAVELDSIDLGILDLLQANCKQSLATIGEKVGLSAPSVMERIHKLEEAGVVRGYAALLDARLVGKDVTAFIGVSLAHPSVIEDFERQLAAVPDVQESHHVTGGHTLMLKARTASTASLERLIDWIRRIDGVTRTETSVVLSTQRETPRVALDVDPAVGRGRRGRRPGRRPTVGEQEGRP